eukprot:TRINITY_DN8119_c0_g1_i18.p1 TRINITY_DN8119_c0_g1~~TRINITY_DN8119_c0_g1_i18.p1  ORF type:complete len:105 (+),score=16.38 TRINITY_DN8119_c0_g1_i18:70-384(+)
MCIRDRYKPNKDFIDYSFAATSCSDFECKHSVATNTDLALGSALLSSCQPQLELEHRGFPAYGIREQATQTVDGWKGKNGMGRKRRRNAKTARVLLKHKKVSPS